MCRCRERGGFAAALWLVVGDWWLVDSHGVTDAA
jgi:hypothetical protein